MCVMLKNKCNPNPNPNERDPDYRQNLIGFPWPMRQLSADFCENRLSSFFA